MDISFNGAGAPTNLRWIQFVETNRRIADEPNPTVYPPNTSRQIGDDNLPFYFTELEMTNGFPWNDPLFDNRGPVNPNPPPARLPRPVQNPAANIDLVFLDQASRPLRRAPFDWDAFLYLVEWDGNVGGTVSIRDGIHWGFTITGEVPEPSTLLLFVAALAGALCRVCIKKCFNNPHVLDPCQAV